MKVCNKSIIHTVEFLLLCLLGINRIKYISIDTVKMDIFNKVCNPNLFPSPVAKTRELSAAASEEASCEIGSAKYYALCGFGGLLSCGITHTAVTPLDLVKCRLQVNKEKYKNLGNGFKVIVLERLKVRQGWRSPISICPCRV